MFFNILIPLSLHYGREGGREIFICTCLFTSCLLLMICIVYTDYATAWFDFLCFQVFTALAFSLFARESVDIAIVEVSIMLVLWKNHPLL